jgi:stage V sporulation protein B
MSNKTKTFVKGAAILGVLGLICKVIGAIFRIPLANIVDTQGMAYYAFVYPVYALLLVVSTAGLPAAIAKMVSERRAIDDYIGAKQVFTTSARLLLIIGVVSSLLLFAVSYPLAAMLGLPKAGIAFMAISPALFFVAIISAYRGYFQGMQMMAPTGFSQLIEQLIKLLLGLWFAVMFLEKGPQYGAAGALLGVSISEVMALLFLAVVYMVKKPALNKEMATSITPSIKETRKIVLSKLLKIAIPVTLGACVMPIVMAIDTAVVIRSLEAAGFTSTVAADKFSLLTGHVNPLINMPAVLSLALAMSLVPAISAYKSKKMTEELKQQSGLGFKIALLVGLPCAVGFSVLAKQIIMLLYRHLSGTLLEETATLLIIMSIGVLMLTVLQTMTGILQGLGKVKIPVVNLAIGAVLKIIITVVLIRIPSINVKGAAIGTVVCYGVAAILDVYFVVKHTGMKIRILDHIIKPVASSALMGIVVYLAYPIIYDIVDSNTIATIASILVGGTVYAGGLLFTKTITKQEISLIRGKNA